MPAARSVRSASSLSPSRTRGRRRGRAALLSVGLLALAGGLAACSPVETLNRVVPLNGITVERDIAYGPLERQKLDLYAPAGVKDAPTVLFIHGGSWEGGDKNQYPWVAESLARAGYVTAVMNYRLAPQFRYPLYVQDAALALKYLHEQAGRVGGSGRNLFVMGHSAGGFNAVEAVVNERWLAEVGVPVSAVRGVIGVAGPYSYDYRDFPSARAFPEGSLPDDVMPDRHVRRDAPPHLLLVAENDRVVYPQNAVNMEAALKRAGVPVRRVVLPRLDHVTIMGAFARPLVFLGGTRAEVLAFIEANRLR